MPVQALRQAFFHEPEVREHARSSRNDHGRDEPIFWHCSKLWITVKISSAGTARSPCLNSADHLAVPTFWTQALLCCLVTPICAGRLPLHELRDSRLLVACKTVVTGSKHGTKEPFNGIAMLYVKLNIITRSSRISQATHLRLLLWHPCVQWMLLWCQSSAYANRA